MNAEYRMKRSRDHAAFDPAFIILHSAFAAPHPCPLPEYRGEGVESL
jgi:hypothetical protein